MDAKTAARETADAILDISTGFPTKRRMEAVRSHVAGTETRIADLETQVRDLQEELIKAQRAIAVLMPDLS